MSVVVSKCLGPKARVGPAQTSLHQPRRAVVISCSGAVPRDSLKRYCAAPYTACVSKPTPFWPACGHALLAADGRGELRPTDDWWRWMLDRPELALVPESCRAERRLHARLLKAPGRPVPLSELQALQDADARDNYRHLLGFRDALSAAGTLQAWLLQLFRGGQITLPPLFIDLVVQAIVCQGLQGVDDALEWRAAEMLFRPQRFTLHEGRVLAGDRDMLDAQRESAGLGDLGRLLAQAQVPLKALDLQVLDANNAARYFERAAGPAPGSPLLLDMTHELPLDMGHGVQLRFANSRSGLPALSRVLARWVQQLLGVRVTIEPQQRIDDAQWRWHIGLDAEASRLLDDLYNEQEVEPERLNRLVSLFKLRFDDAAEMRADVAGKPVYLALMMDTTQVARLKPQNLLLNLPLAVVN